MAVAENYLIQLKGTSTLITMIYCLEEEKVL